MSDTIIIYQSKYGSTKKYAEWLATKLNADLYPKSKTTAEMLQKYDTIVYGGGLYAGGVNGISFLQKNLARLHSKNIVIFATGASFPIAGIEDEIKGRNPALADIPVFFLRGGMDYHHMKLADKIMMSLFRKMLNKKAPADREDWENFLLEHFEEQFDFTDPANLQPLLDHLQTI
ncbi:MAG: flavodoxin domain-containing protein [Christensenella sp.]|uniref:flavodoxin domain-containing protein n=1 Tax=Christensenella sp. TaxID=1935934 RepID=UPI002B1FE89F|nr:flavodoxin domain-containing protein [Christensenella sp.]MEA5002547.1 flavodoxin domain-containing protein [Christensenella sp.]